jgi:hypothetical protein
MSVCVCVCVLQLWSRHVVATARCCNCDRGTSLQPHVVATVIEARRCNRTLLQLWSRHVVATARCCNCDRGTSKAHLYNCDQGTGGAGLAARRVHLARGNVGALKNRNTAAAATTKQMILRAMISLSQLLSSCGRNFPGLLPLRQLSIRTCATKKINHPPAKSCAYGVYECWHACVRTFALLVCITAVHAKCLHACIPYKHARVCMSRVHVMYGMSHLHVTCPRERLWL